MARGYWVHNLEHGGIVLLHRRDAPASVVTDLTNAYRSLPADPKCGDARALLTPDAEMPRPVAVVAANWRLDADGVDPEAIRAFVLAHRDQAPESICAGLLVAERDELRHRVVERHHSPFKGRVFTTRLPSDAVRWSSRGNPWPRCGRKPSAYLTFRSRTSRARSTATRRIQRRYSSSPC